MRKRNKLIPLGVTISFHCYSRIINEPTKKEEPMKSKCIIVMASLLLLLGATTADHARRPHTSSDDVASGVRYHYRESPTDS